MAVRVNQYASIVGVENNAHPEAIVYPIWNGNNWIKPESLHLPYDMVHASVVFSGNDTPYTIWNVVAPNGALVPADVQKAQERAAIEGKPKPFCVLQ